MREVTFAEAVREAIAEEMRADESVFVCGENVGSFGGMFGHMKGLYQEFGKERILDTPISEAGMAGVGFGAAITGMRPIVEITYCDFMTIASDQVVNQITKAHFMFGGKVKVPVVIKTAAGSGRGQAAQHSQSLENWFTHIPGLQVVMPATPYDAKGLMKSAIRSDNPVLFIEHKNNLNFKGEIPDETYTVEIGKADVKRKGSDMTVVSYSQTCLRCLEAAEKLAAETGIQAEVIDLRTLSPLDIETVKTSVKKTKRLMVAHEAVKFGGFGGEVVSEITESDAFYYLDAPIVRVGAVFAPIAKARALELEAIPTVEKLLQEMKRLAK